MVSGHLILVVLMNKFTKILYREIKLIYVLIFMSSLFGWKFTIPFSYRVNGCSIEVVAICKGLPQGCVFGSLNIICYVYKLSEEI